MRWVWVGVALSLSVGVADAKTCRDIFKSKRVAQEKAKVEIIPSGRDAEIIGRYREAIEKIFGAGGLVERLGLSNEPHAIEFLPSAELSLLAVLGRHAIKHWYDGAKLASGQKTVRGVLEFVTPGCPTCRSFYDDTTKFSHQISVLLHVAGHNDFAAHSLYNRMRKADPIAESLKLHDELERIAEANNREEVMRYYQHLQSTSYLQDVTRGGFEEPSKFDARGVGVRAKFPRTATPSLLQAMVENLSPRAPEWKREVLRIFERMERVVGYYASQKIMNEGWATMMQEILAKHSEFKSSHEMLEVAKLMRGVAGSPLYGPGQWNPYWLGREAWKRLYSKFRERDEIRGRSELEIDRAFIRYAHELIEQKHDFDFLRMALDEKWVRKHNLFLTREAEFPEWDPELPPPKRPELDHQFVVTSTDYRRVVDHIAHQAANRKFAIPKIVLERFDAFGRGVVSLRQELYQEIPLEIQSSALSLYVLSQLFGKPVSLDGYFAYEVAAPQPEFPIFLRGPFGFPGFPGFPQEPIKRLASVRVEVDLEGRVTIVPLDAKEEGTAGAIPKLKELCDEAIAFYKSDDVSTYPGLYRGRELPRIEIAGLTEEIRSGIIQANLQNWSFTHAPTAAGALSEYKRMLNRRLDIVLKRLMNGEIEARETESGLEIQAMPLIPNFTYDHEAWEAIQKGKKPAPIDLGQRMERGAGEEFGPLAAGERVGQGDRRPGDRYWGQKPKPGEGKGKGKGKKKGDKEGEKEPGEIQPGEGGTGTIVIPFDLYGKLLAAEVELPFLRPLDHETYRDNRAMEGAVRKPVGDILFEKMVDRALAIGRKILEDRGEAFDRRKALREGMKRLQPDDYVVRDFREHPEPNTNAVVVFTMDMSGSMTGEPYQLVREFLFNLKALLQAKYDHVTFRFVGFSGEAKEFLESEFFQNFMGGGTQYAAGTNLAIEIMKEYPDSKYDRYLFTAGDFDCFNPQQSISSLQRAMELTRFSGFIFTPAWGNGGEIAGTARKWSEREDGRVGFATLKRGTSQGLRALKELFNKKD